MLQKVLDENKIKYFTAPEILNASGTKKYDEIDIPADIFYNIIPTIRVLDELREWYGFPIYLNCTYRSPEHNKKVGGAKNSIHMKFNAVDFSVANKNNLKEIYNHLNYQDSVHHFLFLPKPGSMGLGLYDTFIHIDTRGVLGLKSPARWDG